MKETWWLIAAGLQEIAAVLSAKTTTLAFLTY